jgi:hypothetical protein
VSIGAAQPDDADRPPSRKRRGALILALTGGLAAVILMAVTVVAATTGDDPKKTSAKAAHEAGRNLRKNAALSLKGTYGGSRASFTVTRAGSARADYTLAGDHVSRVDVGGTAYLKTGPHFWKAHGESSAIADYATGKWTKAPYNAVELSMGNLSPDGLGQNLLGAENDPLAKNTVVNGVKAIRMTTAGLTYFISTGEPRRVLRVEGRAVNDTFSLDITPLTTSGRNTFLTRLRTDVQALKDAYNPNIIFEETGGTPRLHKCDDSGCTATVELQPNAWGGSNAIHIVMVTSFIGNNGEHVSSCTDSALATSKILASFSCRTRGSAWTRWFRSHNGRFTVRALALFRATVNSAQDIAAMLATLTHEQQTV